MLSILHQNMSKTQRCPVHNAQKVSKVFLCKKGFYDLNNIKVERTIAVISELKNLVNKLYQ